MTLQTTSPGEMLWRPIPNMDRERMLRAQGYANLPVDPANPRYNDPLVRLEDYGIASQSYWANPNSTGLVVPAADPAVTVRRPVAEALTRVQATLQNSEEVRRYFGGPLRLMVRDGLRSPALQELVHDDLYPKYLSTANPDWLEEEVLTERDQRIGKPSLASPHASGGVVDLALTGDGGEPIHAGYDLAARDGSVQPDFYESHHDPSGFGYRMNRRLLHGLMTREGFTVNPVETWHYGMGDRLSAKVTGTPAYYDAVAGTPDLRGQ